MARNIDRQVTFKGETRPLTEWANLYGIGATVLHTRLAKMPMEEAIKPVKKPGAAQRRGRSKSSWFSQKGAFAA